MMTKIALRWSVASLLILFAGTVWGQSNPPATPTPAPGAPGANPDASGSASLNLSADGAPVVAQASSAAASATNAGDSWFAKHLPVDGMFELGTGLGLLLPSSNHNFRLESVRQQEIGSAAEIFVRAAWLPIRFAGVETEWAAGATTTKDDDNQTYPWAIRFHAIGQVPLWRITPFALVGLGRMGNVSNTLGSDGDPLFHFGAGAKVYLTDDVMMRLDLRDNMTQKYSAKDGTLTHSPELLVGVSLTLGRQSAKAQPLPCPKEDDDGDGIVDVKDRCPAVAGDGRDGCPVLDGDKDGVLDDTDKCPDTKGVAPTGCPSDRDEDGIIDEQDKCPGEKGIAPDGCPDVNKDTDSDGIVDVKDKCPKEAENANGFEDTDGCPDVIPERIKEFTGIIQGINFDNNLATIRPESKGTLDKAAVVLKEYSALRVAISGHTDNTGPRDRNVALSQARADAVKKYLVSQGITDGRIETRGAGPDEPADSNATAAGRARNRRIEFKLIGEK